MKIPIKRGAQKIQFSVEKMQIHTETLLVCVDTDCTHHSIGTYLIDKVGLASVNACDKSLGRKKL